MSRFNGLDYGTPASTAAETVKLEIDGVDVTVPAGTIDRKSNV